MPLSLPHATVTHSRIGTRSDFPATLRGVFLAAGLLLCPVAWADTGPGNALEQTASRATEAATVEQLNAWGLSLSARSSAFLDAHPLVPGSAGWDPSRRMLGFLTTSGAAAGADAQVLGLWRRGRWTWPGRFSALNSQASRQLRDWIVQNGLADDLRHDLGAGEMQRLLSLAIEVTKQDGFTLLPQEDGWLVLVFSRPRLIEGAIAPAAVLSTARSQSPFPAEGGLSPASAAKERAALLKEGRRHLAALDQDIPKARAALAKARLVPIDDDHFMAVVNVSRLPETVKSMESHLDRLASVREALAPDDRHRQALRDTAMGLKTTTPEGGSSFASAADKSLTASLRPGQRQVEEFLRRQEGPVQESARLIREFNTLQRAYYENLHGPIPLSPPMEISN